VGCRTRTVVCKCQLCGAEQNRHHLDRHLFRIHQIGEWKPGFSVAPSRAATNGHTPEHEMEESELSTCHPPVGNVTVVPVTVHQSMVPEGNDGSSAVNRCYGIPIDVQNSVDMQQVPSLSVVGTGRNTPYQAKPVLSDNRTVVSRAQAEGVGSPTSCAQQAAVDLQRSGDTLN